MSQKSIPIVWIVLCIVSMAVSTILFLIPLESLAPVPPGLIQLLRTVLLFFALIALLEKIFTIQLYNKIFIGLILGALAGILIKAPIAEIRPIGTAFIRMIQMIIIPLVFASLLVGTASLGDGKKMGRIGAKTFIYYLMTTALAIIVGLILANILKPGAGLPDMVQNQLMENYSAEASAGATARGNPINTLLNIIPTNPFEAMGQGILLQIIFFAIFMGIALAVIPSKKAKPVIQFFEGVNDAMIAIVHMVIKLAPYGVFALVASVVGSFGMDILLSLFKYTVVTILGMLFMIGLYPLIVRAFTGMRPGTFTKAIRAPQMIAFSTSSSSAALPVTIDVCEQKLAVPKNISSFVLPLGATINMDGTALYHGVSAIFIAQVYGMQLGISDQLLIILTATLASIGAAGAPGAGIIMLVIVLEQVGIPLEGISLIMGVERILDMFRTTVNITGDASAAVVIASSEGELGKPDLSNKE